MFCLRNRALPAICLAVCASTVVIAQTPVSPLYTAVQEFRDQGGRFQTIRLFRPATTRDQDAFQIAPTAQFLHLDIALETRPQDGFASAISLEIPYHGEVLVLDLVETNFQTTDFTVVTNQSAGQTVPYTSGRHFRGILRGDCRSLAAVSFIQGEMVALISDDRHGNLVLGKLESTDNVSDYILYADRELAVGQPFSCTPLEPDPISIKPNTPGSPEVNGCVRVYFEVDHELFQNKGSVQATVDYLASVFNQVSTLYANEQINITLSQVFVWVSPDNYSTSSSSSALTQFRSARKEFNGDIAHLVGIGGNNLGGVAYLDVLCVPSYAYGFSDINMSFSTVPTFSWTVEVLTHEMGHNLGSPHTQSCSWPGGAIDNCFAVEGNCASGPAPANGGTIMSYCHLSSYGINFSNGFGPLPGNKIRTEIGNAACLSVSCAPASSCTAPSGLSVNNVSSSNATITWNNVGPASGYTLQWRPVGTGAWATVSPATSPYTLSGLPASNVIEVRLKSMCGSASSDYTYGILFTTGSGTTGGSTCAPPASLSATATAPTSASVSWSSVAGASGYQLSYKPVSATAWSTPVSLISTSYTLTQLAANSTYQVRVSATCASAGSGYASATFTTPSSGGGTPGCGAPSNLKVSNTTATSANISWNAVPGAQYYELRYQVSGSTAWINAGALNTTSYLLTGLSASTVYNVLVRSVCSSSASTYSKTQFTTSGSGGPVTSCPTPLNFILRSISANTAIINWNSVAGAVAYDLQIRKASSSSWLTFSNLPATVVQITNMQPGTAYQMRVRTRCSGANNYSAYSNILTITTLSNLAPEKHDGMLISGISILSLPDEANQLPPDTAGLDVFPNPTSGIVTLQGRVAADTAPRMDLTDLDGRLIASQNLHANETAVQFDLRSLPSGVYLAWMYTSRSAPVVKRLIKE
ncbi:MAG: fibronectin type III domain-containing protein [Saprospirales bacterium]|nr:fibronectin type III domain-containing protein [Saprospirales bacterium]